MIVQPDILLIALPLLWGAGNLPDMKQPLNLLYLASWLNNKGLRAQILDAVSENLSLKEVLHQIEERKPRFVGVPFYQATRDTTLELCREIRRVFPQIWIVGGGPLATTSAESLLDDDLLDLIVVGEGELSLEEILRSDLPADRNAMFEKSLLHKIAGIAFCESGRKIFTAETEPIADLDSLPFLDFGLINIHRYFAYHASIDMSDWLFLTTSRGCNARCVFCATPVLWPKGMRRQSVKRVLDEIVFQRQRYPTSQFGFMDDSFFSDKKWLHDFCEGIRPMQIKYCCIGRADHLNEKDVAALASSGCIYVAMGIETGSQLRQHSLKKNLNLLRVKNSVELLKRYGIFSKGFFMLGFPDEDAEDMLATINFAVELKTLGMGEFSFFPVSIYPGTELAEKFSKNCYVSRIYRHHDGLADYAEERMRRYANIPDADVNFEFNNVQIINIVRFAYLQVEAGKFAKLEDLLAAAEKVV
jgi:radical SAM superfamily enzyme YgiQ (UPF0313 family)